MKKSHTFIISVFVSLSYGCAASALSFKASPDISPGPPTDLVVIDTANDAGESVELDWSLSETDIFNPLNVDVTETDPSAIVATYSVERKVLHANGEEVSDTELNWQRKLIDLT